MTDEMSRRSVLATGGSLIGGGVLSSVVGATGAEDAQAADPPPIRWAERYDGAATDSVQDVIRTGDGDYVVAGLSGDGSGGVSPWVFSVDADGGRRWMRTVDTDRRAGFNSVVETGDGGYLLGGYRGRPTQGQAALFVRLSPDREVQWQRTVESPRQGGNAVSVIPAGDGQYVVAGIARGSELLDISTWVFGVDSEADRQWSETYGPRYTNFPAAMTATGEGGYVVGGGTRAEATESDQQPPYDAWLFAVDGEGAQQWSETYTESTDGTDHRFNLFYDVQATGSNHLAAGITAPEPARDSRGWVVAVEDGGARQSQLQSRPDDAAVAEFRGIQPDGDGYAVVGAAQSEQGDPAGLWAAGIDGSLAEQWSATKRYANGSQASAVLGTDDGGLLAFGIVNVEGSRTSTDALAVKLGGEPVATATPTASPTDTPDSTPTPTPTATPSPTPTPTATPTATPAGTATPTDAPTDAATTSDGGPGFGVGGTLAALTGGAFLRRVRDSDTETSDQD